jgi:hypothetical protein
MLGENSQDAHTKFYSDLIRILYSILTLSNLVSMSNLVVNTITNLLPPYQKKCRFRIHNLSQKACCLLNLACAYAHVDMQQSVGTKYGK